MFFGVFKVCVGLWFYVEGRWIYDSIVEVGLIVDLNFRYVLVDMYVKCVSCSDVLEVVSIYVWLWVFWIW